MDMNEGLLVLIGVGVFSAIFFPIMIHKINKNMFPDLYKSKISSED